MNNPFDCITDFIFVANEIDSADVILIPGANHPQLMEKASSLYKQGYAPFILPSGGYKDHVGSTEWEYLRQIGIENGVPVDGILKEDKAQHTLENARFSFEVLQEKGIQPKKVIIVCKACHSRRALLCYQAEFPIETEFIISPVIDRFGITKDNWYLSEIGISRTMSEVEKIGKYCRAILPNLVSQK